VNYQTFTDSSPLLREKIEEGFSLYCLKLTEIGIIRLGTLPERPYPILPLIGEGRGLSVKRETFQVV